MIKSNKMIYLKLIFTFYNIIKTNKENGNTWIYCDQIQRQSL